MNPDPAEVFPEDITVTSTSPGLVAGGIVAVILVEDTTVVAVAVMDPNITVASEAKLYPMIVAVPPPERGEESGVIEVMVVAVVRITMSLKVPPTASQELAEIHDTPLSTFTPEGRVWFVQVVPFHESAMPTELPEEL